MKTRLVVVLAIIVLGVGLDLWSKAWAEQTLKDAPPIEIVENFFHFSYVGNPHGAFSIFRNVPDGIRRVGLIVASMIAVAACGFLMRLAKSRWMTFAFSLVLAGAFGNLYDRIFLGYVRDFIDWHYYRNFTWPTFNLADSYISVGVTILVIVTLFSRPEQKRDAQSRATASC